MSAAGGLAFPLSPEASEQVDGFRAGSVALVLLSIQDEMTILRSSAARASTADVAAALPVGEPCFMLFSFSHEHEGSLCNAVVFLYACPENSPVKKKMLHASTKGTVVQALEARGITITKRLEGVDPSDLSDEFLKSELYPPMASDDGAMPSLTKAAPKGGRRLTSRNKR